MVPLLAAARLVAPALARPELEALAQVELEAAELALAAPATHLEEREPLAARLLEVARPEERAQVRLVAPPQRELAAPAQVPPQLEAAAPAPTVTALQAMRVQRVVPQAVQQDAISPSAWWNNPLP